MRGVAQPTFRRIKQFLAVVSSGQTLPLKNATLKAFHDRFEGLMAVLSWPGFVEIPSFDPLSCRILLSYLKLIEMYGGIAQPTS